MLTQKKFTLLLGHLLVDLFADIRLQARHVEFFLQQHQHLFHAFLQAKGFQHILQSLFGCSGEAGGKIGQLRRLIRPKAIQKELEFLGIQRVEREQILDRVDDGNGIRTDFFGIRLADFARIFDPDFVRRRFGQPLNNTKAPPALGNELHFAVSTHGVMNPCHGTNAAEVRPFHVVGIVWLDHHQPHHVMRGFADDLDRRQPRRFVHQQRQGLRGEKRLFGQRQQVQFVRQDRRRWQLAFVGQEFTFERGVIGHDRVFLIQ